MENEMFPYKKESEILYMPLAKHLPKNVQEKHPDWKKIPCPYCGNLCYESGRVSTARELFPKVKAACTVCALELEELYGD